VTGRGLELTAVADELEPYRPELTAFCRRMLGSHDAEDAVQETFIRAVRSFDRFERRGTVRSWLYRIARNVCFDMLDSRKHRAQPIDLGPVSEPTAAKLNMRPEATWIEPMSNGHVVSEADPADMTEARETVRLALVAALQHLPPKQRAVLILCEVLQWKASEAAELLETSVASVSSALQRARATLASRALSAETPSSACDVDSELLARYVQAFERFDLDALTDLIRADTFRVLQPAGTSFDETRRVAQSTTDAP
jgi:RNA polymerase sigma-70 factor, ECF subfamily